MLSVVTPAENRRLTTLSRALAELGADASVDPALVEFYIDSASAQIESYCRRVFAQQQYLEKLPATGEATLLLARSPVLSIDTVTYKGEAVTDVVLYDEVGVILRTAGFTSTQLRGVHIEPYPLHVGELDWEFTYTAGYALPGDDTPTLPSDLERACLLMISRYAAQQGSDPSIIEEKVGDSSVKFQSSSSGTFTATLPAEVRGLLAAYRLVF